MALMSWSDNLSVNIKEIDEQHKKLVGMVNDLHDAMKMGKGNDVTGKILTGLIQYVGTHFACQSRRGHVCNRFKDRCSSGFKQPLP